MRYVRVPALERGNISRWYEDKHGNIVLFQKAEYGQRWVHWTVASQCGGLQIQEEQGFDTILKMLGEGQEPQLNLVHPVSPVPQSILRAFQNLGVPPNFPAQSE